MNQRQQELTIQEVDEEIKEFLKKNPEIAQKIKDVMDEAVYRAYILVKFSEIREELKKQEKASEEKYFYEVFMEICLTNIRIGMVTSLLENVELLEQAKEEHLEEEICKIINVYNFCKYVDDVQKSILSAIKFGESFRENLEELLEE